MIEYHDSEWGVPVHDDRLLFEFLILEGAQAGLSWDTILKARTYRKAFAGFDPDKVARFTAAGEQPAEGRRDRPQPAEDRHRDHNATAFLAVQGEFGSFDATCGLRRRRPVETAAHHRRDSGEDSGVRRDQQGSEAARLPLRRLDDLLRLHAGGRDGQRPHPRLFPTRTAMSLLDPQVLAFALVAALMTISPGAEYLPRRAQHTARRPRRRDGLRSPASVAASSSTHCSSALGVSAILAHSATAFLALKVAGAAYLAWLGIQSLRTAARGSGGGRHRRQSPLHAWPRRVRSAKASSRTCSTPR